MLKLVRMQRAIQLPVYRTIRRTTPTIGANLQTRICRKSPRPTGPSVDDEVQGVRKVYFLWPRPLVTFGERCELAPAAPQDLDHTITRAAQAWPRPPVTHSPSLGSPSQGTH